MNATDTTAFDNDSDIEAWRLSVRRSERAEARAGFKTFIFCATGTSLILAISRSFFHPDMPFMMEFGDFIRRTFIYSGIALWLSLLYVLFPNLFSDTNIIKRQAQIENNERSI